MLTTLISQCMNDSPLKRPSSLTVLQVAREELALTEKKDIPLFLPERPTEMDYVYQAILELLERLCHSFKIIEKDLRKHLTDKINNLLEDGKLRSADCWGLEKCIALPLVLAKEDQVKALLSNDTHVVWDCPWNTYDLDLYDIAHHAGLPIIDSLETSMVFNNFRKRPK